ncbi:GtrA family protein [Cellvibrio zantedeschiae]|uniref:GtrA family protein n=1 Tax=Cellvibrio zantedeschiae TaxID=1237077 RepID=UPI00167B2B1E|nr:GtrA family protein [Cellvibrio zantedeschiae]
MVRFIKFVIIGGAATLLQFLFLGLFVEVFGLVPTFASALSYCCSAVFNYLANYYFTFGSNSSHKQTLPKFIVTVALGMALSTTLFAIFHYLLINFLLVDTILINSAYLIAQLFATLLTLIANFLMHKFWIYRR